MAKKDEQQNDLVKAQSTALSTDVGSYEGYADAGFEGTTAQDYKLGMIGILQKMSPQVDPDSGQQLPGARAGMIMNNVTLDLYEGADPGIVFIPVHRDHKYVEWRDREKGGGFVATHAPESPEVIKAKKDAGTEFGVLPFGQDNYLKETFYVYGLLLDENGFGTPAVIPFASTQIQAYKSWMTKARSLKAKRGDGEAFTLPLFAHRYRLRTQLQENNKGKFHGWQIGLDGATAEEARIPADSTLAREVAQLRDIIVSGAAQVDVGKANDDAGLGGQQVDADKF